MNKIVLDYAEFHITNVCNFNCIGCNKLNNYSFSGAVQKWDEYAEVYQKWSEKIELRSFTLLGGEPMTNPDYLLWFKNISSLWPSAGGKLTTNGYYLKSDNRELYDILNSRKNLVIKISLHNTDHLESMIDTIKNFLVGPIKISRYPKDLMDIDGFLKNWSKSYNNIRGENWPDCNTLEDWEHLPGYIKDECKTQFNFSPEQFGENLRHYQFEDSNGVIVTIENNTYFHQASAMQITDHSFKLYNSNVDAAHKNCDAKTCHQFYKGKLYKCYLPAMLPDFGQQFLLEMSDDDFELLHSYKALTVNDSFEQIEKFIGNIKNTIPQCKFCPENYNYTLTKAEHGNKIKIVKKKFL